MIRACTPPIHYPCRSELARESVGSVDINVEGRIAIASKLAPTGWHIRLSWTRAHDSN
ncbi:hypothetical protein EMIT0P74_20354 [Pseudomonas sp. IT-P74]